MGTTISNDISVIKLAEDIEFNDAVQPICLPKADFEYADGSHFLVTGWGRTVGYGAGSDVLKQAILPNHDAKSCFWGQMEQYRSKVTEGKLVCADIRTGRTVHVGVIPEVRSSKWSAGSGTLLESCHLEIMRVTLMGCILMLLVTWISSANICKKGRYNDLTMT